MKKDKTETDEDPPMRDYYDFSGGVRGKHYERYRARTNIVVWLPVERVDGPHPVCPLCVSETPHQPSMDATIHPRFPRIVASMRDGWGKDERPLLVHECDNGRYRAWGGMHRLEAARQLGLDTVPAVVMKKAELLAVGYTSEALQGPAPWELDDHRGVLRKLKDPRPHELRESERRVHDSHWAAKASG